MTVCFQGLLSFTSDNMITNPYQFSALEQKENSLCEHKFFLTDYILRYEAVNSMSFLLTQKSTGLFSSAKMTDLATDVYMR